MTFKEKLEKDLKERFMEMRNAPEVDPMSREVERLRAELRSARHNAQRAREERDAALVKISKAAGYVEPSADPQAMADEDPECGCDTCRHARNIREILGVCPLCGLLGRMADAPCPRCTQPPRICECHRKPMVARPGGWACRSTMPETALVNDPCGCSAQVVLRSDDPDGVARCHRCGWAWRSCVATRSGTATTGSP